MTNTTRPAEEDGGTDLTDEQMDSVITDIAALNSGDLGFNAFVERMARLAAPGAAAAAPSQDAEDAARWRHAKRCVRMDNFGGYVVHPDDPAEFNGIVAERFEREIDAARAAQAQGAELVTVGAMHQCRKDEQFSRCVHCGAIAEQLARPCKSFLAEAQARMAEALPPSGGAHG